MPGYDPRSGEGARRHGGRFNLPQSYAAVYLCSTRACAAAELARQASRQGLAPADLLPRELWKPEAELASVLDLTAPPSEQVRVVVYALTALRER